MWGFPIPSGNVVERAPTCVRDRKAPKVREVLTLDDSCPYDNVGWPSRNLCPESGGRWHGFSPRRRLKRRKRADSTTIFLDAGFGDPAGRPVSDSPCSHEHTFFDESSLI